MIRVKNRGMIGVVVIGLLLGGCLQNALGETLEEHRKKVTRLTEEANHAFQQKEYDKGIKTAQKAYQYAQRHLGEKHPDTGGGFIYAGTPSLLASLWKVDDKATAILMQKFYDNWRTKKMSKPEALRRAQLSVRAMDDYTNPYYWAAFVMIGDWL